MRVSGHAMHAVLQCLLMSRTGLFM